VLAALVVDTTDDIPLPECEPGEHVAEHVDRVGTVLPLTAVGSPGDEPGVVVAPWLPALSIGVHVHP
jgi:hypothetical protein